MNRCFRGLGGLVVAGLVGLTAMPTRADTLFAVRALREGGCGGLMPPAQPLHHNPLLDRTAAEWAAGRTLSAAADFSGYRAASTAGLHVVGPEGAMVDLLKRGGCRTLASPGLHEVGIYRRGMDAWIVLATGRELSDGVAEPAQTTPMASPTAVVPAPRPLTYPVGPASGGAVARVPAPGVMAPGGSAQTAPPVSTWATPAPTQSAAAVAAHSATARADADSAVVQAAPNPTFVPVPKSSLSPILATRALQLVNNVRTKGTQCGKELFGPAPPLILSGTLAGVAFGHATDMAANNYFEHEDLQGKTPSDRVRATGYEEKLVGENIAYGPKSVDEVVQGWLDSPGHCENIMDPRFVEMGMGYATSRDSKHALYWVQVFATPKVANSVASR